MLCVYSYLVVPVDGEVEVVDELPEGVILGVDGGGAGRNLLL